jgi:hypothetical protein
MAKFSDLFTQADGSLCPARVACDIAILHFFIFADVAFVKGGFAIDLGAFTASVGGLCAVVGTVFAAKDRLENVK